MSGCSRPYLADRDADFDPTRELARPVRCIDYEGHEFASHQTSHERDRSGNLIGVLCAPREEAAVREFFELFKTPWAMFDASASYDAVLVSGDGEAAYAPDARLIVWFDTVSDSGGGQFGSPRANSGPEPL